MIGLSIHNVTEIGKARVHSPDNDGTGWITLNIGAQQYSWDDEEENETISNEVTLFFKNMDLGLAQLQDQITLAIAQNRREAVREEAEKEAATNE